MVKNSVNLTNKQAKLIVALLSSPTKTEACRRVGVSPTQYRRYLEEPVFVQAYTDAVNRILEQNINEIQLKTKLAIDTLVTIVEDKSASAMARLQASKTIIEFAFRAKDTVTNAKLDELEELVKNGGNVQEVTYYEPTKNTL